jgi:hypothetical protein
MKMSRSPARRFPQKEHASMAWWRQVSLSPPSRGSMPKNEEVVEDAIIFQRWS